MAVKLSEKQVKDGWQIVKFGEIAKNISERVEPSNTDLKVYVGLEHLDPQSLRITRRSTPADVKGQKLRVRPGQIIFGKRRAYQKKVAVADFDGICSAHAMVLEEISGKIIPGLLPFFMQSDTFMDRAITISEGSLSPTIKWKTLAVQEFSLPPTRAQKKILKLLDTLEDISLKYEAVIESGDFLFRRILQDEICHADRIGERSCISQIATATSSPVDKKTKGDEIKVRLCNYMDVYRNREITSRINFMCASASQSEIDKFTLFKGDVVITKDSETPNDIGVPAYVAEDIPDLVCGYHLTIIRPSERISGKYLAYVLSSPKARHDFIPYAQGITRFGLSSDAYKRIHIAYPSLEEQEKVCETLDSLQETLDRLKGQIRRNASKRKRMLQEWLLNSYLSDKDLQ